MNLTKDFTKCPRCKAPTEKAKAISGAESEFWYTCTKCNTYINTYYPQDHQASVHKDSHRYVGNFGAYGTGKTLTSREELYKHLFLTPNANILIGANVSSQYEQTIKREIEGDLPLAFVKYYSSQKQYIDFINGARILFRPFDDPNKLRSYNLTMFIIVEASECKPEVFTQLKTRLRNLSATLPKKDQDGNIIYKTGPGGALIPAIQADWRKGLIESNPDSGWIRQDVLLTSHKITKHGRIPDQILQLPEEIDQYTASHVAATEVNLFLPEQFIAELTKNKPLWWVNRYVRGSFLYAEGTIYPGAMRQIIPTEDPKKHWRRIVSFDYGLVDDAVFIFGAVSEEENMLYIYKEVRTNNKNVEELAQLFHINCKDIPVGGWICQPIIDPKSGPKRDYDKKTLADHFLDYNINFKPGHVSLDARIYRLNTYLERGRIKIMDCCTALIKELKDYKFKAASSETQGFVNKPEDKNNHGVNALEWITMELPADPNRLVYGIYNKQGVDVTKQEELDPNKEIPFYKHALSDDSDNNEFSRGAFSMMDYEL